MKFTFNIEAIKALVGECVGSFLFLYISLSSVSEGHVAIALTFGLTIGVLVYYLADISGGHLNPAVSLALAISGHIDPSKALLYILSQVAGASLGALTIYKTQDICGANSINNFGAAFLGEIFGTFVLVSTVYAVIRGKHESGPFYIGLSVTIAHFALLHVDGCSINPARTFASSLACGKWDDHWLFWLCPLVGGALAALVHKLS
jgi:MIP family channel proteins